MLSWQHVNYLNISLNLVNRQVKVYLWLKNWLVFIVFLSSSLLHFQMLVALLFLFLSFISLFSILFSGPPVSSKIGALFYLLLGGLLIISLLGYVGLSLGYHVLIISSHGSLSSLSNFTKILLWVHLPQDPEYDPNLTHSISKYQFLFRQETKVHLPQVVPIRKDYLRHTLYKVYLIHSKQVTHIHF